MNNGYDYPALVDKAMRNVVKDVLTHVQYHGLDDPHHFFITFRTDYPGVGMSDALRAKYPNEITIVLQHQFRELRVEQDCFKVVLSFNNIPERLTVPYAALSGFSDPSVKFGLQFHLTEEQHALLPVSAKDMRPERLATDESPDSEASQSAKVITLDAFRKK